MAQRATRADKKAETRERLLRAAERIVADHGFAAITMEGVAERAGLTKGAIYSNFESKEDLVIEVVIRMTPGLIIDEAVTNARDVDDMLERVADALLEMARRRPKELLRAIEFDTVTLRDPKLARASRQRSDPGEDANHDVARWFAAHAAELPLPIAAFVEVLNAVGKGLVLRRLTEGPDAMPDELVRWTIARLGLRPGD